MAQDEDGKSSIVRFKWGDVLSDEYPDFEMWVEDRMTSILGAKVGAAPQVVNHHYNASASGASSTQRDQGAQRSAGVTSSVDESKHALSTLQKCALKGWSGCMTDYGLARVWSKLESTSDPHELRLYIEEAWQESLDALGIEDGEVNRIYWNDKTLKEWKRCEFAPGGGSLNWAHMM